MASAGRRASGGFSRCSFSRRKTFSTRIGRRLPGEGRHLGRARTGQVQLLLVEDEESLVGPMKRGLEEEGYHVEVARDGEQGLRQALTKDYGLFVIFLYTSFHVSLHRDFEAQLRRDKVRLASEVASEVVAAVDPAHLEAVLENLLDNAIKYTPPGGTVTVSTYVEGRETVLRITDTGVGFTEEEAARLFDRFYRADTHPLQQVRGSGLGLSIAKAVADAYGGRVDARSPGRNLGSTFEVRLPLAQPEGAGLQPAR